MNSTNDHTLRVPQESRTALIEPPFDRVPELVEHNREILNHGQYDFGGRSLAQISQLARADLLEAALRWTAAYRNVPADPPDPKGLIYLAGHQPQMFHPGVWFKNYALGALAQKHNATAINLIVDNDVISDASLAIPGGSLSEPNVQRIPFDLPEPKIPFEERKIVDRELFGSFGKRAMEQIASLVPNPLMAEYWPMVQERARHGDNLGVCLVQARHQLEERFSDGRETLEVPQSRICSGEAFQWFVVHILANMPRFRDIYNEAVREYRIAHRIRSRSHPVPELAADGSWLESPFWIWTAQDPRRRRLFCRTAGDEILLTDRRSWEARLPLRGEKDAGRAVERLMELQRGEVIIRSRALMTTLWARLVLGDLFIHGIGGAKYDQVTDLLIERFFGLRPPSYLVVSATVRLPVENGAVPFGSASDLLDELRSIQQELWAMTHHPEKFLGEIKDYPVELVAQKRQWIETPQILENARQRCRVIRHINASLQPWIAASRSRLMAHQTETSQRFRNQAVLTSREYAFCLFPESELRSFMERFFPPAPKRDIG